MRLSLFPLLMLLVNYATAQTDTLTNAKADTIGRNSVGIYIAGGTSHVTLQGAVGETKRKRGNAWAVQVDYCFTKKSKVGYFSVGALAAQNSASILYYKTSYPQRTYDTVALQVLTVGMPIAGNANVKLSKAFRLHAQVALIPSVSIQEHDPGRRLSISGQFATHLRYKNCLLGVRYFKPFTINQFGIMLSAGVLLGNNKSK